MPIGPISLNQDTAYTSHCTLCHQSTVGACCPVEHGVFQGPGCETIEQLQLKLEPSSVCMVGMRDEEM